jgi:hypothetical protein
LMATVLWFSVKPILAGNAMPETLRRLWFGMVHLWLQILGPPTPSAEIVLGSAVAALLTVLIGRLWLVASNVVTIIHEGGHAIVALLTGRRLRGARLHSDTSGVTLSRGMPSGAGMVATALAGYLAAPVLGFGFATLLATGHIVASLWLVIVLLGAMLVLVRNAYGVASILVLMVGLGAVALFGPTPAQAAFAYFFAWFVLLAAVRPVWELQLLRRFGRGRDSDADQLASLTGAPGWFWVLVFGVASITLGSIGGYLMIASSR